MSQSLNVTYKYLRNEPKDQNPFLPINLSEDQIRELHQEVHAALFVKTSSSGGQCYVNLALGSALGLRCI